MFTTAAVVLIVAIAWWVERLNRKDRESRNIAVLSDEEVRTAVLHTRQDVKLLAFLLGAILIMPGVIADRFINVGALGREPAPYIKSAETRTAMADNSVKEAVEHIWEAAPIEAKGVMSVDRRPTEAQSPAHATQNRPDSPRPPGVSSRAAASGRCHRQGQHSPWPSWSA